MSIADRYTNAPSDQLSGSSGQLVVDGYTCASTSGDKWQKTGHASDCTNGNEHISLDGPYQQYQQSGPAAATGGPTDAQ